MAWGRGPVVTMPVDARIGRDLGIHGTVGPTSTAILFAQSFGGPALLTLPRRLENCRRVFR